MLILRHSGLPEPSWPFLFIGGDGRSRVVIPPLDDVERPVALAGVLEFEDGQGSGLVRQLGQYSFVSDFFETA